MAVRDIEIKLSYRCNQSCIFCWVGDQSKELIKVEDAIKYLDGYLDYDKINNIHISGGEPTIYPDIESLIQQLYKRKKESLILHTNAIKLSDETYFRNINKYIKAYYISFHAIKEESHAITTKVSGSLKKQMAGIKNCTSSGKTCILNTVITNINKEELSEIVDYMYKTGVEAWMFTFPFISGTMLENKDIMIKDFNEFKKYLLETMEKAKRSGIMLIPNGIPYCYIEEYLGSILQGFNYLASKNVGFMDREIIDISNMKEDNKKHITEMLRFEKTKECEGCILEKPCCGFWREIILSKKWPEFKKIVI